jgi:hypothetical protein
MLGSISRTEQAGFHRCPEGERLHPTPEKAPLEAGRTRVVRKHTLVAWTALSPHTCVREVTQPREGSNHASCNREATWQNAHAAIRCRAAIATSSIHHPMHPPALNGSMDSYDHATTPPPITQRTACCRKCGGDTRKRVWCRSGIGEGAPWTCRGGRLQPLWLDCRVRVGSYVWEVVRRWACVLVCHSLGRRELGTSATLQLYQ